MLHPIPTTKEFNKIIQFYLFETPVRTYIRSKKSEQESTVNQPHPKYNYTFFKVSKRGISFAERGIDGPRLNVLRAAMMRVTNVKMICVVDDVKSAAEALSNSDEYIIIKRNENRVSVTEGYFYCIRNAFAHGDFDVNKQIYTLKNEAGGKVKGLARLKESSLLAWIDLVNKDIDDIRCAGRKN